MARPCTSCGTQILFLQHPETGKWSPIDDEASADGNIRLTDDGFDVLGGGRLARAREQGEKLHLSHFVTCPNAWSFKSKGKLS